MEGNLERIKELANEVLRIIERMEKEQPFKSEVGKSFQQKLMEKMELKEMSRISDEL